MAKNENKSGKRAGVGGAAIAALILLLGGGAWGIGLLPGGGNGNGEGNGTEITQPANTKAPEDNSNTDVPKVENVLIKLDQSVIYVNGEKCGLEELNEKISQYLKTDPKPTFEFKESNSIKSKYDEVTAELKKIEDFYDIHIKGLE